MVSTDIEIDQDEPQTFNEAWNCPNEESPKK